MKKLFPTYVIVPAFFFAAFIIIELLIDSGDHPAFLKYPMVSVFLLLFLFLLISIEVIISAVDNISYQMMTEEEKKKQQELFKFNIADSDWFKNLMAKLTQRAPLENEHNILLAHDYDGIKELDNNLPPWWVYCFYGTILFAAIYLVRFEIMDGDNQETEFKKEMNEARIAVEEYKKTAPDLMDEKTVVLLTEPVDLLAGKAIFATNCVACHRADAGGQVGPNLTDNRWILGGGIKNVFHTITNGGRDSKGMIAWKASLKPKAIQLVASYVLSLQGSNPKDPKAPDGEVWVEPATTISATTSTKVK